MQQQTSSHTEREYRENEEMMFSLLKAITRQSNSEGKELNKSYVLGGKVRQ